MMAVQMPRILLYQNAFLAPVRNATRGGRIRDRLTNESLLNMPSTDQLSLDDPTPRRSFSDLLETRLQAEIDKRVGDAWAAFRAGRYQTASYKFDTLSRWKGREVEATLGMLFSAMATQQERSAGALAGRFFPDPGTEDDSGSADLDEADPNPFLADIDLTALAATPADDPPPPTTRAAGEASDPLSNLPEPVPWDENALQSLLKDWGQKATASDDMRVQAAHVLLLWYAGERLQAQRQAERIEEEFRTSPFANMADAIRDALDAEEAADEQSSVADAQPASDS
jgi:hypothetical protein